jgi:hypothetical protein
MWKVSWFMEKLCVLDIIIIRPYLIIKLLKTSNRSDIIYKYNLVKLNKGERNTIYNDYIHFLG